MSDSKHDAVALVHAARKQLEQIQRGYDEALYAQVVPAEYLILYKNFLENLRSALDYTARSLFARYGSSKSEKPHILFPHIPTLEMTREEYDKKGLFNRVLPGVEKSMPPVRDFILKLSEYEKGTRWFLEFIRITNEKKHIHLVRQDVRDDVVLEVPGIQLRAESIRFEGEGGLKWDGDSLSGPLNVVPGQSITTSQGQSITPGRVRSMLIRDHFVAGEADEFARRCCVVIEDVVNRLLSEPPRTDFSR